MPLPESGGRPRGWPEQAETAEFIEHVPGSTEPRFSYERPGERSEVATEPSSTAQRAVESGQRALDAGRRRISDAAVRIQSGAQRGLDGILDALEEGRVRGKQGLRVVELEMQAHPLVSLGAAFVVGIAIGKLIRRSVK